MTSVLRHSNDVVAVSLGGPLARIAAELDRAARQAVGEVIYVTTAEAPPKPALLAAIRKAASREPDAGVFVLPVRGLPTDPAWRGRRCRSHERNFESLRFAHLIPPGGLAVRRELLLESLAGLGERPDGWRELMRRLAARTRFKRVNQPVRRRALLAGEPPCPSFLAPTRGAKPRVLILGQIEVSTSLYFDFLEHQDELDVAFRPLTDLAVDGPHLAAADLVILVRELHRFWDEGVVDFLRAAATPFLYFTDDNFLALQAEDKGVGFYTEERMRRALAGAAELWVSTAALAAALGGLHHAVRVWGPVLDPALQGAPPPGASTELTIALAGGDFRVGGLEGRLMDDLAKLARKRLAIIATDAAAAALTPSLPKAEIVRMGKERSFRQFVRQWRAERVDILLHPAGATSNAPYKCPTAVMVAGYLGAVPVVADEPAYAGWGEPDGVFRIEQGGLPAVAKQVGRRNWRAGMQERLAHSLAVKFDAAGRIETLRDVLGPLRADEGVAAADVLASPAFGLKRAARQVIRVTRRIRDRIGERLPG